MAGRPCNPGSDLKRLWQTLLPGTPFPQCGVPENSDAPVNDSLATGSDWKDPSAARPNAGRDR
ncbi:MAG: hypothetical protein WB760_29865 [Xanthobacteraceae bacterium]